MKIDIDDNVFDVFPTGLVAQSIQKLEGKHHAVSHIRLSYKKNLVVTDSRGEDFVFKKDKHSNLQYIGGKITKLQSDITEEMRLTYNGIVEKVAIQAENWGLEHKFVDRAEMYLPGIVCIYGDLLKSITERCRCHQVF